MSFKNEILAGATLIREAIQSQNYQAAVAGWQIAADGKAEFSDLTIRSSDGSGTTVVVANGKVTIKNGAGATVVEIDASGYRLYNSLGDLVAQITLDAGGNLGGFYCRNFEAAANVYAFLSGGQITSGPFINAQAALHGFLQYVIAPAAAQPYAAQTLSTGAINLSLDDEARIQLISQRGVRPIAWVDGGSSAVKADLAVTGKVTGANLRCGTAQTPAPAGTGGTTTVAVTFAGGAMDATPRITITPISTGDPATTTITGYLDAVTTSGFTIRCYRSNGFATNFSYIAMSA